jgi:hypothetical protein
MRADAMLTRLHAIAAVIAVELIAGCGPHLIISVPFQLIRPPSPPLCWFAMASISFLTA